MKKKISKAVLYARYSSDHQRGESIDAQVRAINEYAKRNNMLIIHEYVDEAKSATTDNRPAFQQMISDSEQKEFEIILVHKLDRFSRNRYDSALYRHKLKRNGVELRSVIENFGDGPESVLLESLIEGMSEFYSVNLAREVMKGLKENAHNAKHTGGIPPLGYDVDRTTMKLVINEHEAEAVRLIFQRTSEGIGYGTIIDELNDKGYRSKRGDCFSTTSLYSVLRNPKYFGRYIYNRSSPKDFDGKRNGHKQKDEEDFIVVDNGCPALVSQEMFDRVQTIMSNRMHTREHSRAKEEYILKGKIVCGECGGAFVGARRRRTAKGGVWIAYGCNCRHRKKGLTCENKEISKPYIEGAVFERLAEFAFNGEYLDYITDEYNAYLKHKTDNSGKLKAAQRRLKALQRDIDSLVDLVIKSKSDTLLGRLDGLEEEKAKLEQEVRELEYTHPITSVTREEIEAVFNILRDKLTAGTLPNIKQIVNTYIDRIEVYQEKAIVYFNFFPKITLKFEVSDDIEKTKTPLSCDNEVYVQPKMADDFVSFGYFRCTGYFAL